jgi:hypothetical protein
MPDSDGPETLPDRPPSVVGYAVGALVLGVSALYGGAALMRDPDDDPLGLPVEWLAGTPFRDYFLPGLTLFGVFGIGSFVVLFGIARRRLWARTGAVALGLAQVGWILVQIVLLRALSWLQLVYGGLGALLAVLATRPSFRAYFEDGTD